MAGRISDEGNGCVEPKAFPASSVRFPEPPKLIVLGVNLFHSDASAAIVVDGKVEFAVAEERLNRVKHFGGFPTQAIRACLEAVGAEISDVDHLALGRDPDVHQHIRLLYGLRNPRKLLNLARLRRRGQALKDISSWFSDELEVDPARLRFRQHNVEHHIAHIASAYYCSGWEEAAGLSLDGSGDFVTTMRARCEGNRIEVLDRVFVPHSLGSFYSMICEFIGYRKYGDEGKVMGLAALGEDRFAGEMRDIVRPRGDRFNLNLDYFVPMGSNLGITISPEGEVSVPRQYSDRMIDVFGAPREPHAEITQRDMDLAHSMQARYEEVFFHLLRSLSRKVPSRDLAMAGGCALNSVANGKLFEETPFRRTWIQPAAGDEGLSLGAALYCWHSILGRPRESQMRDAYLGPGFDNQELETALKEAGLPYRSYDPSALVDEVAQRIAAGAIVGWFQGRTEWGPRALGNRSILAHPGLPHMKDTLNARIKHREWFRPFAPSILEERLGEYFEHDHPSPFMLHVYRIKESKRELLPAVNHVDNSGRLQSVSRNENPLYYDLICAFERRTGLPVLLNTSFNENEPIVNTPREAIDCFMRTKMDVLALGSFLVEDVSRART